jgi:prepilin-type N-terminal cleavage/methylation domain-containing protein
VRKFSACKRRWRARRGDHHSPRRDDGFTLIELVIVIVILPIVVGGISVAVITSLKDSTGVQSRLSDSADAQTTSAFFVRDVESASTVSTSTTPLCAPAGVTTGQILGLEWLQGSVETGVSYVTTAPNLVRYTCKGSTTPVSTVFVDSDVSSTSPPTVSVSCFSYVSTCAANTSGAWPAGGVSNVSLNIVEPGGGSPYQFQLAASPRTTSNGTGGGPATLPTGGGGPIPPLLLLGSGANILDLELGGLTVNVNGTIDMNSNAAAAVNLDGLFNSVNATAFDIYNCAGSAGASCTNGAVDNEGFFDSVSPGPVSMSSQVADPLQNLAVPPGPSVVSNGCTSTSPPNTTTASITGSNQTWTCQPGLYPAGLTISGSNDTVTFASGTYQFGTVGCSGSSCGFTITGNNNTFTFGSGDYGFEGANVQNNCLNDLFDNRPEGGINIVGASNTLNSASGGVFFYVAGGQTNFGCGVVNAVNLAPTTTGTYDNILLWQDKSDALPVVLTGFANSANFYGGTLYAPSAQIQLIGGGETLTTGSVVAGSVELLGVLNCVTIGSTTSQC